MLDVVGALGPLARAPLAAGLLDEVRALRDAGMGSARGLAAIGYREAMVALESVPDPDALSADITHATVAYARRQRTWFRKEASAVRVETPDPEQNASEIQRIADAIGDWWRKPA